MGISIKVSFQTILGKDMDKWSGPMEVVTKDCGQTEQKMVREYSIYHQEK